MAFIEPLPEDPADDRIGALYRDDTARFGYLPNMTRALARRPDTYEAWKRLNGAIKGSMDARRYELVTLGAARALRSSYCMLAHGKIVAERFDGPEAALKLARGHGVAELDPLDTAIVELAEKIVRDATSVDEADIGRLRELGLSDGEIIDVVTAATARCFFSKTLDALGVQADAAYLQLEPELREALTVGRPISEA